VAGLGMAFCIPRHTIYICQSCRWRWCSGIRASRQTGSQSGKMVAISLVSSKLINLQRCCRNDYVVHRPTADLASHSIYPILRLCLRKPPLRTPPTHSPQIKPRGPGFRIQDPGPRAASKAC